MGVGTATPNTVGLIRATNDVIAYYGSDERLKDNIFTISGSLDILKQIGGYTFDWVEMPEVHSYKGHDVGVIAQEIEKILPMVVNETDGIKSVSYGNIVGLLIEAIKELQKEVADLKNVTPK